MSEPRGQWLSRVTAVLKGGDFEAELVSSVDGIRIEPLHGQIAGERAGRALHGPWMVQQRADHPDPAKANFQALDDLANGATGLTLVCDGSGASAEQLPRILDGVALHAVAIRLEGDADAALRLAEFVSEQPLDPERLDISFGLSEPALVKDLTAQGFRGPFLEADGRSWHEAGCTAAQELGAVLATGVAHLRALDGGSAAKPTIPG